MIYSYSADEQLDCFQIFAMSNNAAMNNFILKSFCNPIRQTTIEYLLHAIHWSEQWMAKQKLMGHGSCIQGAPDLMRETDHNK